MNSTFNEGFSTSLIQFPFSYKMIAVFVSLFVLFCGVANVDGCSTPIDEIAQRFDLVLIGAVINHFSRAGGLVDSKLRVLCVLKGDGIPVEEIVFVKSTQFRYPCTNHATPTVVGRSYVVGVSRINRQNFTWSLESRTERVAVFANPTVVKSLTKYCIFQDPQPPSGNTGGICPRIREYEKDNCRKFASRSSGSGTVKPFLLLVMIAVSYLRLDFTA